MLKTVIISSIFLLLIQSAIGQKRVLFQHDITTDSKIKDINDWHRVYINNPDVTLVEGKTTQTKGDLEWKHQEYKLLYKNIPIEYSIIKAHKKNSVLELVNGEYYPNINLTVSPKISEEQALLNAQKHIGAKKYSWESDNKEYFSALELDHLLKKPKAELVLCSNYFSEEQELCLAYKFEVYAIDPLSRVNIYINAIDGYVIHVNSMIKNVNGTADTRYSGTRTIETKQKTNGDFILQDESRGDGIYTYNMASTSSYSNTNFIDNDNNWSAAEYNNASNDNAGLDAHWGAMMFYDYFSNIHGRNSYDDNGAKIKGYVNANLIGLGYNSNVNAFWDGNCMTYGIGDNNWDPLTSLDVISHEISHAVTENTANLVYEHESGALNEAISDIFAACVENFVGGASFGDIWSMGEDIDLVGGGLRFMNNPNLANQPDTYGGTNWFAQQNCIPNIFNDNCGVHTNSGVLNYWFHLLSVGGIGVNDNNLAFNVSGITIEKAELIIYKALTSYFTPNTDYQAASELTIFAAQEIYGTCAPEVQSVIDAWHAVGVTPNIATNLVITQTLIIPFPYSFYFHAIENIIATNLILTTLPVTYKAGETVSLKPGFNAVSGTNFHAYIEHCLDGLKTVAPIPNKVLSDYSEGNETEGMLLNSSTLNHIADNIQLSIAPNPTTGIITMTIQLENLQNATLSICDVYGRELYRQTNIERHGNVHQFDFGGYTAGMYMVRLETENKTITQKVIVQ